MLSIIVPSYNEGVNLGSTLKAITKVLPDTPHEVIVVDDCSTNGDVIAVEQAYPHVQFIRHTTRKGTSGGRVTGAQTAKGDVLCFETAGSCGFTGARKCTPFAAQRTAERVADKAKRMGIQELEVKVKGPGSGRESAITALEDYEGGKITNTVLSVPLPVDKIWARVGPMEVRPDDD